MKRRVIQLVLLLLAGAIVNVAVAWAAVYLGHFEFLYPSRSGRIATKESGNVALEAWEISVFETHGFTIVRSTHWRNEGPGENGGVGLGYFLDEAHPIDVLPRWARPLEKRDASVFDSELRRDLRVRSAAGWPSAALWQEWKKDSPDDESFRPKGGFVFREPEINRYHAMPLQPLWPGFAINTIFYAAILWVMIALPLALRRKRRMQRGLCPACAYPVGTSNVCTECGAVVSAQKPEHHSTG